MKIEIASIESKLNEPEIIKYSDQIVSAIGYFVEVIKNYQSSDEVEE